MTVHGCNRIHCPICCPCPPDYYGWSKCWVCGGLFPYASAHFCPGPPRMPNWWRCGE